MHIKTDLSSFLFAFSLFLDKIIAFL